MKVVARSWCRVDLAGGTLDIWPLGLLHPGAATLNLAVDLAVTAEVCRVKEGSYTVDQEDERITADSPAGLRRRGAGLAGVVLEALEAPACAVRLTSSSPRGGGLGASSALTVALIAAVEELLGREPSPPRARAALARDLEARLMGLPTGIQDHYPALLGGALEIRHLPGGERVRPLAVDLEALGQSLLVAYSGSSHFSAGANWQVVRRRLDGERGTARLFDGLARVAERLGGVLEAGDLPAAGSLLSEEWRLRRQLAEAVSTPSVEALLEVAERAGAWGGKVCGAGGGGCLAVLCPPARRGAVAAALNAGGGRVLAARPTAEPLAVDRLPDPAVP